MGSSAAPAPIRLAILEADTPLPNTNAKFHGYGGVFTDLFRRAVAPDALESHLAITTYDVVNHPEAYPDLDAVDAVLISGSKHSAYLDEPWINRLVEFVQQAVATGGRAKVVGVCFGHQIVGRALGAKVAVNEKGWEVSVTEIKLSAKGREVFGSDALVRTRPGTRRTTADVEMRKKKKKKLTLTRKSTKCTATSSSSPRKAPRTWPRTTSARSRAFCCPARPSPCRAIPSSRAPS